MKGVKIMGTASSGEWIAILLYFALVIGVGVYFFFRDRNVEGEKEYFLGGRSMGGWVAALSAGASDMSAWVLMGLPGSIYLYGIGKVWIAVGLVIGTICAWVFVAPRLRRYSIRANDSITIPQFLTNRFQSKNKGLQIISAIVFVVVYCIYSASSISACGTLFNTVTGMSAKTAMIIATAIILVYVFLGGFNAVCWTDFFQGMLMLGALLIAPIFALFMLQGMGIHAVDTPHYFNAFSSWKDIVSGLGWGLGYFGMPHIIIRFMSLESQKSLKKSAKIGITWTVLIVIFAAAVGIIGRLFLGYDEAINGHSLVFITMVRKIFPGVISGLLLSAVLAASMSTADSQLLMAASAFASDVYKPVFRKGKASDKEMMWAGRIVVLIISVVALIIASNPNSGTIMSLVSNAWGVFGAAFGPVILLSLFWKRFTFAGAVAGIVVGAAVDGLWLAFLSGTGIYEIIPAFAASMIAAIVASLLSKKPGKDVEELFDKAVKFEEE